MRIPFPASLSLVLPFALLVAWPARAQETRTDVIASQQEAKEQTAKPYEKGKVEEFVDRFEAGQWFISPTPRGFYPTFASIYPGTGFTVGAGYRKFIGYESYIDGHAMVAWSHSTLFEASFLTPNHFGNRVDIGGSAGRRNAIDLRYYGLGPDTTPSDVSYFSLTETYGSGFFTLRPIPWFELKATASVEEWDDRASDRYPSIETMYTPDTAPLLGKQAPVYLHGQVSGAIMWLQSPGYSRKGGLYRFTYQGYQELQAGGGRFGMNRGEIVQHIPILRENWVLSLRGRWEAVLDRTAKAVPYFMMPYLGSGSTLRAYSTGRFRGMQAVLASAEWRWIPSRLGMDMAVFVDAGEVSMSTHELAMDKLQHDYGIGVRLHAPAVTVLRMEMAHGSEGWHFVITTSAPF